jgi:UDP:flavonoid glycosyltransferase YjiC (YdhE family)
VATFLLTTMPSNDLGLLTRSLPIGRELRARGHRVLCSNPAPAPRRLIEQGGFENALPDHALFDLMGGRQSLGGAVEYLCSGRWRRRHASVIGVLQELVPALPLRRARPTDDVWSMDHAGAMLGMMDPGFVRASCRAMLELVHRCNPNVVVDFWNPAAVIAARAAGKPLVTVIQADAHPLSRGFVWWKAAPSAPPSCVPAANRVLAELGLPGIRKMEELSVGDVTLVVGSPETDPLPPGADVTYVGMTLWQEEGAELPAWVEALGRDRPLVWVYSGNPRYGVSADSLDSAVVLEACVTALAGEDLDVVLTTGHHDLPDALRPLPARFRHTPFLPGLSMASRCDVLVHHGGYGSCQTGLHAGKPAVTLPTFSERESNARRLAALGAAELVEVRRSRGRKSVDAEALRSAVRRVLADASYGERARGLGDRLRAYGGPARAATLIERLARERGAHGVRASEAPTQGPRQELMAR